MTSMLTAMEMTEFYEVVELEGSKKINRLGFFANVMDENPPYAWYNYEHPVVDINLSTDELFGDEEPKIILMDKEVLEMRLGALEGAKELHLMDVDDHTPCGLYYSL